VELREKRGWSQRELGRRANLSGTCINKVENGTRKMTLETAVKVAKALNVSLDELAEIKK
jgi:transcriptional regulator with XRE-family HTH domain